jgi:catecholate siderophore receptor
VTPNRKSRPLYRIILLGIVFHERLCAEPAVQGPEEVADSVVQLERVVVDADADTGSFLATRAQSGTRTETPLIDLPETIDVVRRDLFDLEGARSLEDVLGNVAGVGPSVGDGQRDQVYLRGFAATNDEYIDGVRDSEMYFRDLANIGEVEVVMGPAAALYGRGSAGGIINRITRKPSDTPVGEFELSLGSRGEERAELDAGGPLGLSDLSYRLDAAQETSGGFRDQYFLGRGHVSPSVEWKPSKDTRVLVQLDALADRRLDDLGVPALVGPAGSGFTGSAPAVPISSFYGSPDGRQADYVLAEVGSATVTIDWSPGADWTLHEVARAEHYTLDRNNVLPTGVFLPAGGVFDGDLSAVWVARSGRRILRHQNDLFDQLESLWSTDAGGVAQKVLIGIEVARQTAGTRSAQFAEAPVALVDPVPAGRPAGEAPSSFTATGVSAATAGLYAQDQITFFSQWKALAGIRVDYFSVEQDSLLAPFPRLANVSRAASPRAGLVWQPSKVLSLYTSAERSFQPSGDGLSVAATSAALGPQETVNVEVGSRMDLAGGRLTATAALFQAERNISETNPPTGVVTNAGDQRSRGAEVSLSGRLAARWRVTAGYSLVDARIVNGGYDAGGILLDGRRPGLVPRDSATFFTTYDLRDGLGIGAGAVCMGGRFTSNDDSVSIPAFAVLSGVVYYRHRHWEARLNLNNILNHRYYATAGEGTDTVGQTLMPGAPFNTRATLAWRF